MIYDLSVKNASHAVRLNPGDFDDTVLANPQWLKKRISGSLFTEAVTWSTLRYVTPDSAESRSAIYDEAWLILKAINDKRHNLHSAAMNFLEYCGPVCMSGIFRASFPAPISSFKNFTNGIDWLFAIPESRRFGLVDDYLDSHLSRGIELAFQEKNPVEAVKEIKKRFSDVTNGAKVIRAAVLKARSAKEYLELSAPDVASPSESYLKSIAEVHNDNFSRFLELNQPMLNFLS